MEQIQESEILKWLEEEATSLSTAEEQVVSVPIQLIMMRVALSQKRDINALTKSTEISLSAFDRASLYRVLRQLLRRGLIEFVNREGSALSDAELKQLQTNIQEEKELGYVQLTPSGRSELERLSRLSTIN